MSRFLCWIGWHKPKARSQFFPSIHADIVTEVRVTVDCSRCGRRFKDKRLRWNGKDLVPVEEQP